MDIFKWQHLATISNNLATKSCKKLHKIFTAKYVTILRVEKVVWKNTY